MPQASKPRRNRGIVSKRGISSREGLVTLPTLPRLNLNSSRRYHDYMMGYSPIDNVVEGATYPSLLIVSGLNDPRVAYWEPTKWAQVLRSTIANGDEVLLKMDLAAGHFSAADHYRYLRELAFDYAWLLDKLDRAEK